jgi:tetratricopeptide (TPR) repeat protein
LRAIHASDLGAAVAGLRDSLVAFERAGDARNACSARLNTGYALAQLGSFAEAESALRQALAGAERMGLKHVAGFANHNLGWVLARRGMLDEARALEQDASLTGRLQGDPRLEAVSRIYLSCIEQMAGRLDEAEREALAALALMPKTPTIRVGALAALAGARLAQGRVAEALEASREGIALLDKGGVEEGESASRLLLIEALVRSDLRDEAREAARTARDRLEERAARIGDRAWRESFLARVPEHARTLELAAELGAP